MRLFTPSTFSKGEFLPLVTIERCHAHFPPFLLLNQVLLYSFCWALLMPNQKYDTYIGRKNLTWQTTLVEATKTIGEVVALHMKYEWSNKGVWECNKPKVQLKFFNWEHAFSMWKWQQIVWTKFHCWGECKFGNHQTRRDELNLGYYQLYFV